MVRHTAVILGAILAAAVTLLCMLGIFWILELAPLLLFVGVGVAYGVLSSKRTAGARSASPTSITQFKPTKVPHEQENVHE